MATVRPHRVAPILFSILYLPSAIAASQSFNFNFSHHGSFNHGDLKVFFLNSTHPNSDEAPAVAYIEPRTEMIHSEMEIISQNDIAGVVYAQPVTLWDEDTSEVASFRLSLAFCLRSYQDGTTKSSPIVSRMAIFIGPHMMSKQPTTASKDQIIEVEFDAYLQEKQHMNSGHTRTLSIDINYIVSKAQVNTTFPGNTMNRSFGCTMLIAQIDYDGGRKRLDTGLQIGDVSHHINASVDLRRTMPREAAVGFVSTTGQPIQLHNVLCWSFNSTLGGTNSTRTAASTEMATQPPEAQSPTVSWWEFVFRLDPRGWSTELILQFQFQRIWDTISLAVSSSFNITLVYGMPNWI